MSRLVLGVARLYPALPSGTVMRVLTEAVDQAAANGGLGSSTITKLANVRFLFFVLELSHC
jgi:hypothetical protein